MTRPLFVSRSILNAYTESRCPLGYGNYVEFEDGDPAPSGCIVSQVEGGCFILLTNPDMNNEYQAWALLVPKPKPGKEIDYDLGDPESVDFNSHGDRLREWGHPYACRRNKPETEFIGDSGVRTAAAEYRLANSMGLNGLAARCWVKATADWRHRARMYEAKKALLQGMVVKYAYGTDVSDQDPIPPRDAILLELESSYPVRVGAAVLALLHDLEPGATRPMPLRGLGSGRRRSGDGPAWTAAIQEAARKLRWDDAVLIIRPPEPEEIVDHGADPCGLVARFGTQPWVNVYATGCESYVERLATRLITAWAREEHHRLGTKVRVFGPMEDWGRLLEAHYRACPE